MGLILYTLKWLTTAEVPDEINSQIPNQILKHLPKPNSNYLWQRKELKKLNTRTEKASSTLQVDTAARAASSTRNTPTTPRVQTVGQVCNKPQDVPLQRQVIYDGKGTWDSFIKPFQAMAHHCGWSDEEIRFRLLSSLREDAAEYVYSALPPETLNSTEQLERALEDRFSEKKSANTYLAALEQRKLGPKETMTEYAVDIRRLTMRGFPTADAATREAIELRHFIRGLGDQQMIIAVGMKNPINI